MPKPLTVRELIALLQTFPQDALVAYEGDDSRVSGPLDVAGAFVIADGSVVMLEPVLP